MTLAIPFLVLSGVGMQKCRFNPISFYTVL